MVSAPVTLSIAALCAGPLGAALHAWHTANPFTWAYRFAAVRCSVLGVHTFPDDPDGPANGLPRRLACIVCERTRLGAVRVRIPLRHRAGWGAAYLRQWDRLRLDHGLTAGRADG